MAAFSIVQYVGSGITGPYPIPFPYLLKSHVEVRLDGVLKANGVDYSWATSASITFTAAVASPVVIDIRRNTSRSARLTTFADASQLTAAPLNQADTQDFYLAQEAFDSSGTGAYLDYDGKLNANSLVIKNVADGVNAQDAVTMAQFAAAAFAPVGTLAIANGGTGVTTAAAARSALGLGTFAVENTATSVPPEQYTPQRNRIINGTFRFDQVKEGSTYSDGGAGIQGPDMWTVASHGGGGGRTSIAREADPDYSGEYNALVTVTTNDASVTGTEYYGLYTIIEGYNTADLGWGAAGAKSVTLSFEVKSSVAGTFGIKIGNSASDRSYLAEYTINAANTVERKTITIPGDVTGTWLKTSGNGILVAFYFGVGGTYHGSTGWQSGNYLSTASQTPLIGTLNATFRLKRVQLERGDVATKFVIPPFDQELAAVRRYAEKSYSIGTAVGTATSAGLLAIRASSTAVDLLAPFTATKRDAPTMSIYATDGTPAYWTGSTSGNVSCSATYLGMNSSLIYASGGMTDGESVSAHYYANARLS